MLSLCLYSATSCSTPAASMMPTTSSASTPCLITHDIALKLYDCRDLS